MCGICGIVNIEGAAVDAEPLGEMVARLRHRGPDETACLSRSQAAFGHTRLSILDLSGGRQPMQNDDKSLTITFNGEIFNYLELREELIARGHRFRTQSDTEVILRLYEEQGESCVERFNGQWAFAIWDAPRRKLFLSRDRLGIRPLFYTRAGDRFVFASEIKALLACPGVPREFDLTALDQIFTFWVTLPPRTAFRNIWQLPPGHSLVLEDRQVRVWPHWRLDYPAVTEIERGDEKRLGEQLLALLLDATRLRLRADVPVGTYLSGGLDSTLVTALTCQWAGDHLRSFGVSFENPDFDEGAYQHEASAFLETQHSDLRCAGRDIAGVFPDVIRHTEQPVLRTAPAPLFLLSREVRRHGIKVVLTGEGSDEVLGGYDIFKEAKIRRFWAGQPGSRWRSRLLKRLYPYMDGIQKQPPAYLKHFFRVGPADLASPFFSHLPRWELTARLKTFFSPDVTAALRETRCCDELEAELPACFGAWPAFCRAQYLEAAYLLPGYILSSQGDRMAMAHSVEGRYPFLDHRVVAFAARLHPSLKMRVLKEKYLLKQVARQRIPESIVRRPKQPYRAPDAESFLGGSAPYLDELMSPEAITRYGIFSAAPVSALMAKFRASRAVGAKDNMAVVGILSTQLVAQQFIHHRGQG